MDKRRLGRTDLETEPVIFGCNVLGWTLEENDAFRVLAWAFGIPGLILSYVSSAMYLPIALRALDEGRAARAAA